MIIRVTVEDTREWLLIELQGRLESKVDLNGLDLGRLTILPSKDAKTGTARIRIGNHVLTGSLVPLKNPIAIMRKVYDPVCPPPSDSGKPHVVADSSLTLSLDSQAPIQGPVRYEVAGVARRKLVFTSRPAVVTEEEAVAQTHSATPNER